MYKVFEMRLVDEQDPACIIEVQQKVHELLTANRFRQDELKKEIKSIGAWAIPGLINAMYVYMQLLENDYGAQTMMTELISAQAGENQAARELLFRTGVVESPFSIPRRVSLRSLENLNWKPDTDQVSLIRQGIEEARRLEDQEKEMDLYRLLALTQDEKQLPRLITECKRWIGQQRDFGSLLALIVQNFPKKAGKIISDVLLATDKEFERGGRDKGIAENLTKPLGIISAEQKWLESDLMLEISESVLEKMNPPRHTGLEYLWSEVLANLDKTDRTRQLEFLNQYGKRVRERGKKFSKEDGALSLYRYWFKAVGRIGAINYVETEAFSNDDHWSVFAVLQLLFEEKSNRTAGAIVRQLEKERRYRVDDARQLLSLITGGKSIPKNWQPKSVSGGGLIGK